jgi:hypothetical protein
VYGLPRGLLRAVRGIHGEGSTGAHLVGVLLDGASRGIVGGIGASVARRRTLVGGADDSGIAGLQQIRRNGAGKHSNNLAVLGDLDRACIEIEQDLAKVGAKVGGGDGTGHRVYPSVWVSGRNGRVRRATAPYVVSVDPVAPEV